MATATVASPSSVSKFLADVAEQKFGFRFGEVERTALDSLTVVVPILRETSVKRQYVLLAEAQNLVIITDTGSIDRMRFKNTSKENVFVRSGTIFRGGTQERALTRSAVLFPGKEVELDVRCVHQSKGIRKGTKVEASGFTPLEIDKQVYGKGYAPKDQMTYWKGVSSYTTQMNALSGSVQVPPAVDVAPMIDARMAVASKKRSDKYTKSAASASWVAPRDATQIFDLDASMAVNKATIEAMKSQLNAGVNLNHVFDTREAAETMRGGHTTHDDLATTIDNVASNLDDLLSKVTCFDNQVGLGLITEKGVQCIEVFDVDASWKAIHNDAIKRVSGDLSRKDSESVFEYKPRSAINTIAAALADTYATNLIFDHRSSNGEPHVRVFGLTSNKFIGEVVEIDDRVVHLSLIRMAA